MFLQEKITSNTHLNVGIWSLKFGRTTAKIILLYYLFAFPAPLSPYKVLHSAHITLLPHYNNIIKKLRLRAKKMTNLCCVDAIDTFRLITLYGGFSLEEISDMCVYRYGQHF